jgi:hypothetical protein
MESLWTAKGHLKKQSHFVPMDTGIKFYKKGTYSNNLPCGTQKTKPIEANYRDFVCAFCAARG